MPSSEENFPAVKLRPQTPPIVKRELGDAAIPGERRIHTSPLAQPPPPQPTRAIIQWARRLEWCHAVTLHTAVGKKWITFFPFSSRMLPLFSTMTLCFDSNLFFRIMFGIEGKWNTNGVNRYFFFTKWNKSMYSDKIHMYFELIYLPPLEHNWWLIYILVQELPINACSNLF